MVPPSVETSTPPTFPPASAAVPRIVTPLPRSTVVPAAGDVIVALGGARSVDALAADSPAWSVRACAPMSAKRLTVAWRIDGSAGEPLRSWSASSPHAHWIVPAPNTNASSPAPAPFASR